MYCCIAVCAVLLYCCIVEASYEFYHYDGAKHAFTKSDGPNYNPECAALAFQRTLDFIAKHSVTEQSVSVESENKKGAVPATVYENGDAKAKGVAIVVIQEWWGINNEIKSKGRAFCAKGVTAIVPDLYRGKAATTDQEASHLMSELDWPGAVQDIKGAVQYLKKAGYSKVFVTGYCMGGALALAASVLDGGNVRGGIAYYGIPDAKLADPLNLKVPFQGHFGTLDSYPGFSDQKAAAALGEKLKSIKADYEIFNYEGANHAFTKIDGPNFNPVAAALAFSRTLEFIAKHSA